MSQRKRSRLSPTQKPDIGRRWKAGQSLHEIGRVHGKWHNSIRGVLLPRGGIPPIARRRSQLALTLVEREDLWRGIASGSSLRDIAKHLDRAVSAVSREVTRQGGVLRIEPIMRMTRPGTRPYARRGVFWPRTVSCVFPFPVTRLTPTKAILYRKPGLPRSNQLPIDVGLTHPDLFSRIGLAEIKCRPIRCPAKGRDYESSVGS